MSLTVEQVMPEGAAAWDEFVRAQPEWTPYHLYAWRRIIGEVHGHECVYLGARAADGSLAGVLPLVRVKSVVFGHFLVSMPFLNYGGPLGGAEATRALTATAVDIAKQGRVDLLELRCATELPIDLPVSHRKITVRLDLLDENPEVLWKKLDAKVRSQVRRPMKEGVEVRFGAAELDSFYRVFAHHMRDLGTPVQSRQLFQRASQDMGEAMWFGCAHLRGEPIAAGCGFRWADRFELVWASALREHSRIAPNMALYWAFLERCAADGVRTFDFGRCTPDAGTHKFKRQWGGSDAALWWYQHSGGAARGTPSPDSGPYSLGPRIWSRLPLALANALGPRVVRFIP